MLTKISIAIVQNKQKQILISLRDKNSHQGGKWEFPGGKVETGETNEQAMLRELREEVGLIATEFGLFKSFEYHYPDKKLILNFYRVSQFTGEAVSKINQIVKWVDLDELENYDFPEANKEVIEALRSYTNRR